MLSLGFLSHNLYSTQTLLESLSQLQWLIYKAKPLTQKLLKQGVCCARIEVITSQVIWPSSRIDWPLSDVCVQNDNGPSTIPEHLLSPQFFQGSVFLICVFSFWCSVSVFCRCVFLVPGFVFVHWFPFVLNCASVVFPLLIYVLHIRTRYKALWKKSCNGYLLASLTSFLSKFIVNIR